jgi:Flp pilus assembly protein TadG
MHPTPHRQGGAIAVMVAIALIVLLAAAGLVIDAGMAYLVKARLNAAVDSAALAGARAVTDGATKDQQIASAKAAATTYFWANIPTSYMFSRPNLLSTNVTLDGSGMATIDVTAEAPMPVSLMQIMGFSELRPKAYAQTIRKDLDMALVMDTSGSLSSVGSTVRASAKSFLNKFNVTQDRVALMHFAYGAEIDNAINTSTRGFNRTSMLSKIDSFVFTGGTDSPEGMWNARNQLNGIPTANRSSMRVIVFFSDGLPTALGSYMNFKSLTDCTTAGVIESADKSGLYKLDDTDRILINSSGCNIERNGDDTASKVLSSLPDWYNAHNVGGWLFRNDTTQREFPIVTGANAWRVVTNDVSTPTILQRNIERASRNVTEAIAAKARDEGIIVYTLGLGSDLKVKGGVDKIETGEDVLKCMANVPDGPSRCYNPNKPVGMYCYAATEADLTPCFSRLASAILRISK